MTVTLTLTPTLTPTPTRALTPTRTRAQAYELVNAYGCGYKHRGNPSVGIPELYESVGWKDFCEDVGNAYDTTNGLATELSKLRSANISPVKLKLDGIEQVYQWGASAWDEVDEWTQKEDDGKVYFDPFAVGGLGGL